MQATEVGAPQGPQHSGTDDGNPASGSLSAVLRGALGLPVAEQRQLVDILSRVHGPTQRADTSTMGSPADESQPELQAHEWLSTIAQAHPRLQLQQIDSALLEASPEDSEILQDARQALLKNFPAIAIRTGVERLARQHPVAVTLGLAGLLLAAVGLGRGFLQLLF